jgi:tryptophan-rich sensory protein
LAQPSAARTWAIALFLFQLALNLAWSWIFFHRHAIGVALVEVALLWAAIGAAALVFDRVAPAAAWLMVPYLAWMTFAAILNAAFWRLN